MFVLNDESLSDAHTTLQLALDGFDNPRPKPNKA